MRKWSCCCFELSSSWLRSCLFIFRFVCFCVPSCVCVWKMCTNEFYYKNCTHHIHYQRSQITHTNTHTRCPNVEPAKKEPYPSFFCSFSLLKWSKQQQTACCAKEWYRIHNSHTHTHTRAKWTSKKMKEINTQDHSHSRTLFQCMLTYTNQSPSRWCCIAHFGAFGEQAREIELVCVPRSLCVVFFFLLL